MKIHVGSLNSIKIQATELAFKKFLFDKISVKGVNVDTGVSKQPKSREETYQGAKNRAQAAFPGADLGIGIEAGIFRQNNSFFDNSCCVIFDGKYEYLGFGPCFEYPPHIISRVLAEDSEISTAMAQYFNLEEKEIKQKPGAIGLLTNNIFTRLELLQITILMAIVPFINKYPLQYRNTV
ncbi:MAG: inosine/xanthosine triphosphatase [Promethearchaeota archaeon]